MVMHRIRRKPLPVRKDPNKNLFKRKKFCRFTVGRVARIDYKDVKLLKGFIHENCRITPGRITGTRALYQRQMTVALKRARFLALIPYTDRHQLEIPLAIR